MPTSPLVTRSGKGSPLTWAEGDGNLSILETRTGAGWNDLVADVNARTGANAPSFGVFRDGIYLFAFDGSTMNECWANFHIRHDYDDTGGAYPGMIYPHIHWTVNTASTGTVRFGVEYTAARRDDNNVGTVDFGATQTIYIEHTVVAGEQYAHQVSEPVDGAGIALGTVLQVDAIVMCRFFRDAAHPNDTFPDSVYLITVDIHYPCDVMATPNRQYPFG